MASAQELIEREAWGGLPACHPAPAGWKPAPRPVRVCFMIDRLAVAGTESQLLALIRRLDRGRVLPFLCLLNGEDVVSRSLEPGGCPVLRLGVRSLLRPRAAGAAFRLARFLRRERIDVLQVYFPDSTYLGVLAGRLAGVPFVVRTRNNLGHWLTPAHRLLGRLANRLTTLTVANCEAARQALLRDERPRPESVVVLENGVDLERFLAVPPLDPAAPPRRVGAVANLRPVKGLDVFVRAAAAVGAGHPDAVFRVAGEGELRPALERQVAEAGLAGRFTFAGSVDDVPAFLAGVDVAVLSSRAEGMSNALLEYMAAGRAVVATAVGASGRLIEDGVHGLLVPPDDPDRLAGAIAALLRDPARAARLGAAARQRARECYGREAMVRRFERFYQELVGPGRQAGDAEPDGN
jgi:glycosyltransferase involved in cell wall biosynthesis